MAWRRPGDKPLSEPVLVISPTHICVVGLNELIDCHAWLGITCNIGWLSLFQIIEFGLKFMLFTLYPFIDFRVFVFFNWVCSTLVGMYIPAPVMLMWHKHFTIMFIAFKSHVITQFYNLWEWLPWINYRCWFLFRCVHLKSFQSKADGLLGSEIWMEVISLARVWS